MTIRQKIDAAYEQNTLAPLRAEAQKQREMNDAFHASRKVNDDASPASRKVNDEVSAKLQDELYEALEYEIKSIVKQKHCSREDAKNELRSCGW